MPNIKLEISGCLYDDIDEIKLYAHCHDMYRGITDALEEIRFRLKYGENLTSSEENFLEKIREHLLIPGLDL